MIEWLRGFDQLLNDYLMNLGMLAPIISSVLIVLEGTLAFLPLFVFITINILTLGPVLGVLSSWVLTILGSLICFLLFRKGFAKLFSKKFKKQGNKFTRTIKKLKFSQIVLFIAIPFMPSFFVNMGAGVARIPIKKYFYALIIGKLFVVLFWGYVGSNILECLTNPVAFIKIAVMIASAYLIATFVNKKFNLDWRV